MAQAQLLELIEKVDTLEIVRQQVAAILLLESENQQRLATEQGKNPRGWKLRVYVGRANAWEARNEGDDEDAGDKLPTPIVNILVEGDTFDKARSNLHERQTSDAVLHIDCYGFGRARDTDVGHDPGDEMAEDEALRAARLVRNILMSAQYVDLRLDGVANRWLKSRKVFQPQEGNVQSGHCVGVRLALELSLEEYAPQVQGALLELIAVTVKSADTGQVLLAAHFPHNPTP